MAINTIHTELAPRAVGPYSQAALVGEMVFCSGQVAIDPATGRLVEGSVEDQTRQVMKNLRAVLEAAGSDFQHVVKTTIYLKDMGDFQRVNEVYASFLEQPYPARVTIQAGALPLGAAVEIDAIAKVRI